MLNNSEEPADAVERLRSKHTPKSAGLIRGWFRLSVDDSSVIILFERDEFSDPRKRPRNRKNQATYGEFSYRDTLKLVSDGCRSGAVHSPFACPFNFNMPLGHDMGEGVWQRP